MEPTRIVSFTAGRVRAELKRPFVTALGRRTETVNAGIELVLAGGARGYGEASSSLALAHLKPEALLRELRTLGRAAVGQDARRAGLLREKAWRDCAHAPPAASAFECALASALAAASGLALCDWLGGRAALVESDITLSAVSAAEVEEAAREARAQGYRVLKLKLSGRTDDDLGRMRAARAAHPAAAFILDGNQGFGVAGALKAAEAALKLGLRARLFEQPLPKADLKGLAALRRRSPVPIAVDETVMRPADAVRVADAGAADVINIKLAKSGLQGALEIAAVAQAAGLGLMIGCMMETAAGLSPSVHLALGTGAFRHVDLDSDALLREGPAPRGWLRRGPLLKRSR